MQSLTNEVGGLGVDDELAHLELGGVVRLERVSSGQRLLVDRGLLQRLVEQPLHIGCVDRVTEVCQLHEVVDQHTALTARQQQQQCCDESTTYFTEAPNALRSEGSFVLVSGMDCRIIG